MTIARLRHRIYLVIFTLSLLAVGGCRQNDDPTTVVRMGAGDFNITLNTQDYAPVTKNNQYAPAENPLEKAIFNLHVFLIPLHTNAGTGAPYFPEDARHYYFEFANPYDPGVIKLDKVFFGKYKIFLIANNGPYLLDKDGFEISDLSTVNTLDQAENLKLDYLSYPYELDIDYKIGIPMACSLEDTFAQSPILPKEFTLTRLMAQAYLGEVTNQQPDVFVPSQRWKILNATRTTQPFKPEYQPLEGEYSQYFSFNYEPTQVPLYILANHRTDIIASAASETDRTQFFAPPRATYIFIEGKTNVAGEQKTHGLSVYLGDLGEKGAEDWNNYIVSPNKQYPVNVHFRDMSKIEDDPRISQTTSVIGDINQFSDYLNIRASTDYTINFKVTYINVFNDFVGISVHCVVPNASEAFYDKQDITVFVDDVEQQHIKPRSTFKVPINNPTGQGEINIKVTYRHTDRGPGGEEGKIDFIISNSRGNIQEYEFKNIKYS